MIVAATALGAWFRARTEWVALALGCVAFSGCGWGSPAGKGAGANGTAGAAAAAGPVREIPFELSRGLVAERVASAPLIKHPMFACFDDRGRLYVAGASGEPQTADDRRRFPRDVIRRLEDTDGDGRFDTSTLFADRLTYPQGVLWHDGAVYTASPPSLWRLEDTDDDGVADQRRELVTGFPFTGIADDLHGPCLGPDGRIYWGVGRFPYDIHGPSGATIRKGSSPLIMRSDADGENVEVFSAAMGNPVEAAFTAEGEPFACGTFLSPESMGQGLRDAIIHCVFGGVYSIRDRNFLEDKRTGELLPPLSQLGVSAGSGIMRARGGVFGGDDRIELYSAQFNMHSVFHHQVERNGSTFRARDEPLLTSSEVDFHPTDVLEDADGSLLVVDTGAWFRHCPTSQIGKPNVLGAIYRIRRAGTKPHADPRGKRLDWERSRPFELARRLGDSRFAVRDHATDQLARRGADAIPALHKLLRGSKSVQARRSAVWVLARMEDSEARTATRAALTDEDASVRLVAANAVGLHRDVDAIGRLRTMVVSDQPPNRREAATALGRIRHPEVVPSLLEGLRAGGDRFFEHAAIYALITIGDRKATLLGLKDENPRVIIGSLIALDQMEGGELTPSLVIPLLDHPEPEIHQAALQIVAKRPSWAGKVVDLFRRSLANEPADERRGDELRQRLLAFSTTSEIQELMAERVRQPATPPGIRLLLLETMARAPIDGTPMSWTSAVETALGDRDPRIVRQAVSTAHARGIALIDERLLGLARDPSRPDDLRVEALDTVADRLTRLDPPLFALLFACLGQDKPPLLRLSASRALSHCTLDDGQLETLTRAIADAGALVLPRLLLAYDHAASPRVCARLIAALDKAPGLLGLSAESLTQVLRNYPIDLMRQAEPLLNRLRIDDRDRVARLDQVEPILTHGDPQRGRDVFFSAKAVCSMCHTVQGQGGHVGPDLSRIGSIRSSRDLLEAILFPSSSFARGYEPYIVATIDGQIYSGVIHRETADAIVLVSPDRVEKRLPRPSIEAIEQGRTSVMPRGLDANLSQQELADLVAFLQLLR